MIAAPPLEITAAAPNNTVYEQLGKDTLPSEADLHKYFDEHKIEFEQIQARHILIRMKGSPVLVRSGQPDRTEEEALAKIQELQKKLASGQDFEKLAIEESDDTTSGSNGGQLGVFRRNSIPIPSRPDCGSTVPTRERTGPGGTTSSACGRASPSCSWRA